MHRSAIRWTGPEVITAPDRSLPADDIRAVARLRPREGTTEPRTVASTDDAYLAILARSVVSKYEAALNRAIYPQRRRVQAHITEGSVLYSVLLEPCSNPALTAGDDLASLAVLPPSGWTFDGSSLRFDPALQEHRWLRIEYDAGWTALPSDLSYAMLASVSNAFQRANDQKSRSKMLYQPPDCLPDALRYRVDTTAVPLSPVA